MTIDRRDIGSLKLIIRDDESDITDRGKRKQRNRAWKKYTTTSGECNCLFCGERIARGGRVEELGCQRGEWHHLIKQHFFPAPYQAGDDRPYSLEGQMSRHHLSNLVLCCRTCHGQWENWANGRPHLLSWLFKDVTGQEVPLWIPFPGRSNPYQYPRWAFVQRLAELRNDHRCSLCDREQRTNVSREVYHDDRIAFTYNGKDVRAVHVVPPSKEPDLAHRQLNIVLLCLDCLFGARIDNTVSKSNNISGWKDRDANDWVEEFAPNLNGYL